MQRIPTMFYITKVHLPTWGRSENSPYNLKSYLYISYLESLCPFVNQSIYLSINKESYLVYKIVSRLVCPLCLNKINQMNSKIKFYKTDKSPQLPYIAWGLIQDPKQKRIQFFSIKVTIGHPDMFLKDRRYHPFHIALYLEISLIDLFS